ncbi:MAG: histidine phosphatase family protein [Gemmatimonadales bacterium]
MTRIARLMFTFAVTAGLAGAAVAATPRAATAQVTVFVVRHAEKGAEGQDPSLTADGNARAEALAHLLGDAGVTRIYTSQFKRTRETAAPLAKHLGVTAEVIDAQKMGDLIGTLQQLPAGTRAVVVSHSNLVPAIVERLSGQKVGELTDADYDRIYVVTTGGNGATGSVLYLHFGARSPSGSGPMR